MQADELSIDNKTRIDMLDYAKEVIQDLFYEEIITNLSKIQDPDRYYNWYHGYSAITYPYYDKNDNQLWYEISTYAMSGNISTQFYKEKFEYEKLFGNLDIRIRVILPEEAIKNENVTALLNIDKLSIPEFSEKDFMKVRWSTWSFIFDVDKDNY